MKYSRSVSLQREGGVEMELWLGNNARLALNRAGADREGGGKDSAPDRTSPQRHLCFNRRFRRPFSTTRKGGWCAAPLPLPALAQTAPRMPPQWNRKNIGSSAPQRSELSQKSGLGKMSRRRQESILESGRVRAALHSADIHCANELCHGLHPFRAPPSRLLKKENE